MSVDPLEKKGGYESRKLRVIFGVSGE